MASAYIAWYLFLAGAGGGAFLIGAVVDFVLRVRRVPACVRVAPVTDAGLVAGPLLVLFSSVFLILDLGVPARALNVFFHPAPSIIGLGSWAVLLFCASSFAALLLGAFFDTKLSRAAEVACHAAASVLSVVVVVYSGVYLSASHAVPFLNTPWIPALFIVSALATGMAVLMLVGIARGHRFGVKGALRSLVVLDLVCVVLELAMLASFFIQASCGAESVAASLGQLISGRYAGAFWLGVVGLGCAVPLVMDSAALKGAGSLCVLAGATSTLAGGLCLRFVFLLAALRFNLVHMESLPFWF